MANNKPKQVKRSIPKELSGVYSDTADRLEERLDKCYSQEDYKKFQEDVTDIVLATIKSENGINTITEYSVKAMKEHTMEKWYQRRTVWLPLVISVLIAILGIFGQFYITKYAQTPDVVLNP